LQLLLEIKDAVDQCASSETGCCEELLGDFQGTFSVLNSLSCTGSTGVCGCISEFQQTWTILSSLTGSGTGCDCITQFQETWTILDSGFSEITDQFQQTWTILNSLSSSGTGCQCTAEFQETWTILSTELNTITSGFQQTWTILNSLSGSNTGCSCLAEFQQTWTILSDVKNTITSSAAQTDGLIADLKATVSSDFNQTWTILNDLKETLTTNCFCQEQFQETWTILNAGFNTINGEFQQTWTILNALTASGGCTARPITQADVIASNDFYQITTPGNYFFASDIVSSGQGGSLPVIFITANDVTLDLCGHSLIFNGGGNETVGIFVNTSTNVTVMNGSIKNMTYSGILVNGGSVDIQVENISAINCGLFGIQVGDSTGNFNPNTDLISDIRILNCSALYCGSAAGFITTFPQGGFLGANVQNLLIQNCLFNENSNDIVSGISLSSCNSCTILNCIASYNQGPVNCYGLYAENSSNYFIENCQFNSNAADPAGSPGRTQAAFFLNTDHIQLINCQASNNTGREVSGFEGSG